jgi:hypothetical protein
MKNKLLTIGLIGLIGGCSTVTISPKGTGKIVSKPTYEDSRPFYFFGLAGEQHVDVQEVCSGKSAIQMQSQQTFVDGLLGGITLGIYAPHSVKVWCE